MIVDLAGDRRHDHVALPTDGVVKALRDDGVIEAKIASQRSRRPSEVVWRERLEAEQFAGTGGLGLVLVLLVLGAAQCVGHRLAVDWLVFVHGALEHKLLAPKTPNVQKNWLKTIRGLMRFGEKINLRSDDPTQDVGVVKAGKSMGHMTWLEPQVTQYRKHHEIGTMARLALEPLSVAGRRQDAHVLGRQHINRDGKLSWRPQKTRRSTGKTLTIPIMPELRAALDAVPKSDAMTFLLTDYGRPFASSAAFEQDRRLVYRCQAAAGHMRRRQDAQLPRARSAQGGAARTSSCGVHWLRNDERERSQFASAIAGIFRRGSRNVKPKPLSPNGWPRRPKPEQRVTNLDDPDLQTGDQAIGIATTALKVGDPSRTATTAKIKGLFWQTSLTASDGRSGGWNHAAAFPIGTSARCP